ncbi:MAG: cytochrome c oxidase subunit II [Thermoanaerobaculia bacterium]
MNFQLPFMPEQASAAASEVDHLTLYLVAMSTFFTVLIAGMVIVFAIKYRRRGENSVGSNFENSALLEITWTVIPLLIALFTFGWGLKVFFRLYRPPANAVEYQVTGKQWMWKIQHPTGQREINELHVPLGQPTRLVMTSEDVIHSFYVPAFRVKADVLPGRFSSIWFTPSKAGKYHIFCAEFCGAEHSGMIGWVTVQTPEEYQAWLATVPGPKAPAASGDQLFAQYACSTCHKAESGGRGPSLQGRFGTAAALADGTLTTFDETYIRESILMPSARVAKGYEPIMPAYQGQISEEALQQLILYIKNLPGGNSATAGASPASQGTSR